MGKVEPSGLPNHYVNVCTGMTGGAPTQTYLPKIPTIEDFVEIRH